MPVKGKIKGPASLKEVLLQHLIVFMICIVFPGAVTLLAPASWLTFHRSPEGVRCTARTCVYFVVPYKVQVVDQVQEVTSRQRQGRTEQRRKFGRSTNETVHVDGEGTLEIRGAGGQTLEVSVSPASLSGVVGRSNQFLQSSQAESTTLFVIANWKFGGLMGGVLTSFTAIYVVGYSLGLLKLVYLTARRIVPPMA